MPALAGAQPDLSQRIGRTVADTGAPGYRFEQFRLDSADGQRHYRVRVALPTTAAPAGGYPLAYLLDGNAALLATDAALLEQLSTSPRPPVIAWIGYDNELRIDAEARAYDYTPRRPGGEQAQRDAIGGRRNGGADAFLDLLERQIVPRVEVLGPVDASRRALWGHSYGGVLVLHALFTRPQGFAIHAAADPSLWWGNGQLLREEAAVARWPTPAPRLWLWVGQDDAAGTGHAAPPGRDPAAVDAMRQARTSVPPDGASRMSERLHAQGVDVAYETLPGLSHGQTLGASLTRLLQRLARTATP
ncbi:MAG: alpha/beta hydrolase [Pseudoxanthomonas sp.]|nr:alpha/beta hydrolase [Pseudoxanthomonas sp.]